jgi:hypothetical protein
MCRRSDSASGFLADAFRVATLFAAGFLAVDFRALGLVVVPTFPWVASVLTVFLVLFVMSSLRRYDHESWRLPPVGPGTASFGSAPPRPTPGGGKEDTL